MYVQARAPLLSMQIMVMFFYLQNLKNQIMTTNLWVEQVSKFNTLNYRYVNYVNENYVSQVTYVLCMYLFSFWLEL